MATPILEQYRISDFLEWHNTKRLKLNPSFQRGSVWTPAARSYLIDSILRGFPIPKIYLRTTIDMTTKQAVRDVVDGQQRLRAIIDFSENEFALNRRSQELAGKRYSSLDPELQRAFLEYPIAVGQLINATDDDVLEVFARLNSYSVSLNSPEIRHATYQGEFKWAIHDAAAKWVILWDTYHIVSVRERVRMLHDSLMAEMFGILLDGVCDGGQPRIDKLYRKYDRDKEFRPQIAINRLDKVLQYFVDYIGNWLVDIDPNTPLLRSPHFLMLFAALAHTLVQIPNGELDEGEMPESRTDALSDLATVRGNLLQLAVVIDADLKNVPPGFEDFHRASTDSTHRIASRRIRFPVYCRALLPEAF